MLRFTIIDYTTNPLGDSTVIDEPVGWDGINLRLKRDKTWHGFFDFADDTLSSLQFIGTGMDILKTAYTLNGMENDIQLLIEYQCAEGDTYNQLYLGRFVFSTYRETCGDLCMVEISIEAVNCFMVFKNRYDQQVDLDSRIAFDPCNCGDTAECQASFDSALHQINIGLVTDHNPSDLKCIKAGNTITITGSAHNDGDYTVTNVSLGLTSCLITVLESIVDEVVDTFTLSGCLFQSELTNYTGLNMPLTLPSKDIAYIGYLSYPDGYTIDLQHDSFGNNVYHGVTGNAASDSMTVPNLTLYNNDLVDMNTLEVSVEDIHGVTDPISLPVLTFNVNQNIPCLAQVKVNARIDGTVIDNANYRRDVGFNVELRVGATLGTSTVIYLTHLQYHEEQGDTHTENFTFELNDLEITLQDGQQMWIVVVQHSIYTFGDYDPVGGISARINADSFFRVEVDSLCSPTKATVYMINEAMSRCAEVYTNDCLRVYSDYFGRTDAQPYTSDADGCGSLRCITNGLRIRNAPNSDGSTPQRFNVSMQDIFNALNSTDNIGMGLENDPNRAEHKLLRVEPYEYFYNNSVLMECDHIRQVNKQADLELIFSTIKMGYNKWKTWNINGLNDIFTSRIYRTELAELKNELDRTCQFIASDYAIEWTRRQYGLTTADSRYDNDIFFVCLSRNPYEYDVNAKFIGLIGTIVIIGTTYQFQIGDEIAFTGTVSNNTTFTITGITVNPSLNSTSLIVAETVTTESPVDCHVESVNVVYTVEQGVDSASNILYPDTVMNYRLAPSRNAMRWLKTVLQSYRKYLYGQMVFTSGDGNILGKGEVLTPCRLEDTIVSENDNISLSIFADEEANYPLFYPELVSFEYPVTYEQYLDIYANPYGLIGYQCGDGNMLYGWIEDFQYSPYNGTAQFTLRPKI